MLNRTLRLAVHGIAATRDRVGSVSVECVTVIPVGTAEGSQAP